MKQTYKTEHEKAILAQYFPELHNIFICLFVNALIWFLENIH